MGLLTSTKIGAGVIVRGNSRCSSSYFGGVLPTFDKLNSNVLVLTAKADCGVY